MPVEPYLIFNGRCEEAIEFYKKDAEKSKRVMQSMMQMRKIDIAALQRAYEQR